jgi:hypothetical protein
LTDGQPILSTEGRSGPADQLVFSSAGHSYRWVYVPAPNNAQITNLQVPVGDKGEREIYAALNMANPQSIFQFAVTQPYALVEFEVNGGKGSPANDSFVATKMRMLDGSKEYPLNVLKVITRVKESYADYIVKEQKSIDKAMSELAAKSLKGKSLTGPRERKDLMYVTWMPDTSTLRVHFKTTISDGAYTLVNQGGPAQPRDPPPLKLPPNRRKITSEDSPVLLRAAPPRRFATKTGTTIGVEFGKAFIINKKGEAVGTETLPIESFTQQLNAPPFIRPGPVGPRPLPVEPGPAQPAKDSL